MEATFITTGLICLLAAIVGGGLKGLGFEFPVLASPRRQVLLGLFGLVLVLYSQKEQIADLFHRPVVSAKSMELASEPSQIHSQPVIAQSRQSSFKPCKAGTGNVIVASGYTNFDDALEKVNSLRDQFPQFRFKLWSTVARDGVSNKQFAIVIGHGLDKDEAQVLVAQARTAGVASDAYYTIQSWEADCRDLSGVEH